MSASPNRAREIFVAGLKLAPDQWPAYLQEACGEDDALRGRVQNLLVAHRDAGSFLEPAAGGLLVTSDEPVSERPGTVIGPYKLLQQIGEGGMGTVFMAEQTQPVQRKVALKIIKPGMDSRQVIARFEAERQALALMDHPNIAKVFDGGTTDSGRPYFVMELVRGIPITKYCDEHRLTPKERLELFMPVCQAIQHAHQKGIIHRDLKPSNVLIAPYDGKPVVKVIDFGVAKATGQRLTEKTLFTELGAMVGTLEYMSPEQAELNNQDIDTRSDIYTLGVVLYELLTGTTPLDRGQLKEAAFTEMLRLIREQQPPKPSTRLSESKDSLPSISAQRQTEPAKLTKLVRGELDWIVMKALEKDRNRRYETANGLAMDVQRYLADEPVLACPPSAGYRLRKFVSRNKAGLTMASVSAVALLAVIALIVGSSFTLRLQQEQNRTQSALEDAQEQRARADEIRGEAERLSSALALQRGLALCEQGDAARGLLWLAHGLKLAPEQAADLQRDIRLNLARWHRPVHPLKACLRHEGGVGPVAFSLDGKVVATVGGDNTVRSWETATGKPVGPPLKHDAKVLAVVFSSDGKSLVTASEDKTARVWEVATGRLLGAALRHANPVSAVAFGPGGKLIATGTSDGTIRLWEAAIGKPLDLPLFQQEGAVQIVTFSPDGKTLATAGDDGTARLWEIATGKPLATPLQHQGVIRALVFSPDGKTILTGSSDRTAQLWNVATGKLLVPPLAHQGFVAVVAFSPNGKTCATAGEDGITRLWDTATGRIVWATMPHQAAIWALAFSPDGKMVATGSWDNTARLWDAATGKPIGPALAHGNSVEAVAFSPDGKTVATASEDDGTARLWETSRGRLLTEPLPHSAGVWTLTFSPDGKTLATASGGLNSGEARLWDTATGRPISAPLPHGAEVRALAFAPDGKTLATGSTDGAARLWEVATGRLLGVPMRHQGPVWVVAFSPNGKTLATGSEDGTARLWDAVTGKLIVPPLQHKGSVRVVVFSPDGTTLLTCAAKIARLWEAATGKPLAIPPLQHRGTVLCAAFRPDGKMVATGLATSETGDTAQLWETATGKPVGIPMIHHGWVTCLAFSPDGKTLATGSGGKTARLWDASTGKPVGTSMSHDASIIALAFSADSKVLLTGSWDGTARLWDAATGNPLGTPLRHHGWVTAVAFSPDGQTVATASRDGTARLWQVPPPVPGSAERIVLWTQVLTGMELDDAGQARVLDGATWQQRRQRLQELGGPPVE
jgi:WD40 repeat protein/serine/threonine protein kinase